jgi:hypothetical protein
MARRSCVRAAPASMPLDGPVTRFLPDALHGVFGRPRRIAAGGLESRSRLGNCAATQGFGQGRLGAPRQAPGYPVNHCSRLGSTGAQKNSDS